MNMPQTDEEVREWLGNHIQLWSVDLNGINRGVIPDLDEYCEWLYYLYVDDEVEPYKITYSLDEAVSFLTLTEEIIDTGTDWIEKMEEAMRTLKEACGQNLEWEDCDVCPFRQQCDACVEYGVFCPEAWKI